MRLSDRSEHVPSFLQLELMLNKLKLRQPNQKRQERQRFNTQAVQPNQQNVNLKEYCSIVFDNYENPSCFEQEIKAIDVKSLNRVIQKKPLINNSSKQWKQGQTSMSNSKSVKSIKSNSSITNNSSELMIKFKDHIEQLNRHSHNKISLSSKFRKVKSTLKINNPNENNCSNKQNKTNVVNQARTKKLESSQIKNIIASKIQLHKFSDCHQLLREAGKK